MHRLRQVTQTIIALVVVAVIGVGFWLVLKSLFADPVVAGPAIAASVAIGVFAAGEYFTRQRIAQQYRWDKVTDTYAQFLHLIRSLNSDEKPANIEEFMARFNDD